MLRLILLSAVVWVAGCADDRCSVERRMNCRGLTPLRSTSLRRCAAVTQRSRPSSGDGRLLRPLRRRKMNYQCSADGRFWDDACALECTGLPSVTEAAFGSPRCRCTARAYRVVDKTLAKPLPPAA